MYHLQIETETDLNDIYKCKILILSIGLKVWHGIEHILDPLISL